MFWGAEIQKLNFAFKQIQKLNFAFKQIRPKVRPHPP
jgi:hypothetical protein